MKKLVFFFAAIAFLSSCTKVEEQGSVQEMLRGATWKQTSCVYTYTPPGDEEFKKVDVYEALPECKRDDFLTFKETYSGYVDEGASLCGANDATQIPFTWDIAADSSVMHVYNATQHFGTDNVNAAVTNISSAGFTLTYTTYKTILSYNIPVTYVSTYERR